MRMFSIWQAAFNMACQWKIKLTHPIMSQIDIGRENQRLKSVIQIFISATPRTLSFEPRSFKRAGSVGLAFRSASHVFINH